ncbi:MAG: OB-fold domain-containing protein [Chloroflexi bacterium]|nr:OB-fold domain-containing protein [Chloroflexota bacterium]
MVKQGVVPDELTKGFFEAANDGRLVMQNCNACSRLQNPPAATCSQCKSADNLEWKEMSGKGKIYNYGVVYDCPVKLLQDNQPFNLAVITLDEDPGIQMYSHLPGTPVDQVPVGGRVEVLFEETANGQMVPEWRVVG